MRQFRDIFLTPSGMLTKRNADFVVKAFSFLVRPRPLVRDTSLDGVATRLHEIVTRKYHAPIKKKHVRLVLLSAKQLGILE